MRELINESFNCLKNNFFTVAMLIFTLSFLQIISLVIVRQQIASPYLLLLNLLLVIGLSVAVYSGWLNLIKLAIKKDNKENGLNFWMTNFFDGVGGKFLPVLNTVLFFVFSLVLISYISYETVIHIFPVLKLLANDIVDSLKHIIQFVSSAQGSLTEKDKIFILLLSSFNMISVIYSYIFSFILADIFMKDNNNLINSIKSVAKFILKNFLSVFLTFILLFVLSILISLLGNVFAGNPVLYLIYFFMFGSYVSFYTIMVFLLYEKKTQDTGNNGCDSER